MRRDKAVLFQWVRIPPFFSHQLGSFIGVWLGGYLYDHTGSYQLLWLFSIALGVFAGFINLPIDERAIRRAPAPQPSA